MSRPSQVLLAIFSMITFFMFTLGTGYSQISSTAPKEIVLGAALPLTGGQSREGGVCQ